MPKSETDVFLKNDSEARGGTLHIVDLLNTRVQAVDLELIGVKDANLTRLGTALVYLPFLAVGYLLLLASVMRLAALAIGWAPAAALFGCVHIAIGAWGVTHGRTVGSARRYEVADPAVDLGVESTLSAREVPAARGTSETRPGLPRPHLVSEGIRPTGGLLHNTRRLVSGGIR
jgi:hypothetical protein